ncbi:peptidoglycan recognition protein family protein [Limosilactobacillus reuteri]|uniref:Peptidoglycan recognition protein family protein n=1 Tax=Limosilactobacillus reuteri TaxID=1598 RepID=A0AAW4X4K2_LIMRT|nr:peptidoglycan recognition family protein [Limosilactobacillus reuteri]MCC4477333.1 peptidoglycan recognition protein family protein [Limosilactobacillus reuteri]MCC4479515.1 peptidoglycan recognition protein family protein [Limosilactobacillus reuteri]MCC4488422.1 peptidoglycan recognition protein family protein [Limosilactobacillus reuteri]MCC4492953.1 peptidoglycan recognition protein family protein [Limosilactobacillus reuteri]MCC4494358.1 peptidoglycan recognition protein family protein
MAKRKKKQNLIYLSLIIIVAAIIGGSWFYSHHTREVSNSYAVSETATLSSGARVYNSLSAIQRANLPDQALVKVNRYYLTSNDNDDTYARINYNGKNYFVRATDIELKMNNEINSYLTQSGLPHAKITKQISSIFEQRGYSTLSGNPRGVVIHDTGNENSTISSEVSYMKQNYSSTRVFVHTFIDNQQIINIADTKYMAEGAGPYANPYFVQFEMPHEYTAASFANQLVNAAYYTAYILKQNNLPVTKGTKDGGGTVWTHAMISSYLGGTDHEDPISYWSTSARKLFGTTYNINNFVELVQAYYNQM